MKLLTFVCFLIPTICSAQNSSAVRLVKGKQHVVDYSQKNYQFLIENNRSHGHSPLVVNDVFLWDTLSETQVGNEFVFSFKNESKFPMYVLHIAAEAKNFDVKNIGKSMILPDSSVQLSFRADTSFVGEFYGSISIYYQRNNVKEYYDMWMLGFQSYENQGVPRMNSALRRADTKTLIVLDDKLVSTNKYQLKIVERDSVYYPKFNQVNGEWRCVVNLRNDSYSGVEITDSQGKVHAKGFLHDDFKDEHIFLQFNHSVPVLHTYNGGPQTYTVMDGVYFVQWNQTFPQKELEAYMKTKGITLDYACEPFFTMTNIAKLTLLQKELLLSKYKILLLPAIRYDKVNEFGWGGGCDYYTNAFEVSFYKHVPTEKINAIFKQNGITNYSATEETGNTKSYRFSLPTIVDLKFMALLDKLYGLPEVTGLRQETGGIDGMD